MGNTCASVVGWLWDHPINWEAWSAIGTVAAAALALFLPLHMARKEWARQDGIRDADLARIAKDKQDVIHEVCSTVDRILAYRQSALALFDADNVYLPGFAALERIHENTKTLIEMLELLKDRPELSDGALYVALSGKRLAEDVITQTASPNNGTTGPDWIARSHMLKKHDALAEMACEKNARVRRHSNIAPDDEDGAEILAKYLPLAAAIKQARIDDSGAPAIDVTTEYY